MLEKVSNSNSQAMDYQVKQLEKISKLKQISEETKEQAPQPQQGQSKEQTKKVVNNINDFLKDSNTHLKFNFHDDLHEYYVSIVDDTTNEVIKEIPSKKLLDMYAAMTEYLGLLVDRKV
ncbi:MAG: flagellar protein FlaG [Bacillus sp. (in: Bacteria)]|nr:flagellar protein FlaG [Bacillus sp. (in: firmicutes)]